MRGHIPEEVSRGGASHPNSEVPSTFAYPLFEGCSHHDALTGGSISTPTRLGLTGTYMFPLKHVSFSK